jgi:aminopeptidase-like protein
MKTYEDIGQIIYKLANTLFPICRSITGAGVRETLSFLADYIGEEDGTKLEIHNVPSGTKVFDWTVPKEWIIHDAFIEDERHQCIINFHNHNLHVMGYSTPVDKWVDLEELKKHIFTQSDQPDAIPYVTSYYKERFGFCMSENQKNRLKPGKYHMYIDSKLVDGNLTYGEIVLPGKSDDEVFFSTYICHPSMANNECSGPALSANLVHFIQSMKNRKYTYRFVFIPETIGSITYLSRNLEHMKKHVIAGFNLSCVGDTRDYSIIESRYANTLADRVLKNVLKYKGKYSTYSFLQRGSDERQYNAPGVDIPVVGFSRSKFGEYPEYHTSADDMTLVSPAGFQGSYDVMTDVIVSLEHNEKYRIKVLCEPQLGKRGLYPTISQKGSYDSVKAMTDFIAYSDGNNDLIRISEIIGVPINELIPIVKKLVENELVEKL